jgi:hypothetical protein
MCSGCCCCIPGCCIPARARVLTCAASPMAEAGCKLIVGTNNFTVAGDSGTRGGSV